MEQKQDAIIGDFIEKKRKKRGKESFIMILE